MVFRLLGIAFFLIGSVFLVVGIVSSQSYLEWIWQKVTGLYTEKTMIYLFVGSGSIILGGLLFFSTLLAQSKNLVFKK